MMDWDAFGKVLFGYAAILAVAAFVFGVFIAGWLF
jgi:hypothetical protein